MRNDIQALRGFAVLVVLGFHAKLAWLPGGFLGVDVFFVISGFLITRLVAEGLVRGDFRVVDFYARRARRLLPAAYVTFLGTGVLAHFFLSSAAMVDFRAQLFGALGFSANMVLWRQAGYFQGAAELKPLLHIWSLSLEEQYYFLMPALLLFTPRRWWRPVIVALLLASLVLCLAYVLRKPSAAFYLLPTRAWEMAIGSIGALLPARSHSLSDARAQLALSETWTLRFERALRFAFWPAIIVLIGASSVRVFAWHPGPEAIAVCVATLVVILRAHPLLAGGVVIRALAWVGGISYSLYLVHWPLFALLNNAWLGDEAGGMPPLSLRLGLLGLSFLLAWSLHRWVEEPMHHRASTGGARLAGGVALASALIVAGGLVVTRPVDGERDYARVLAPNHGLSVRCEFETDFEAIPACRTDGTPRLMVWGDSYAAHLIPGLVEARESAPPLVQATRSMCGPLLGVSVLEAANPRAAAERCIGFNDSVIAWLRRTPSVDTVVLSSPFRYFVEPGGTLVSRGASGAFNTVAAGAGPALEGLREAVRAIRALGRKVVIVAPPPSGGFNVGRCLERLEKGAMRLGGPDDCRITLGDRARFQAPVLELLEAARRELDVEVIDFDSYLCDARECRVMIGDTFVYLDHGHLTHDGSVLVANGVSLVEEIARRAR